MKIKKSELQHWVFVTVLMLLLILWWKGYFESGITPAPPTPSPPVPSVIGVTVEEKEIIDSALAMLQGECQRQEITSAQEAGEGMRFLIGTINPTVRDQILDLFKTDAKPLDVLEEIRSKLKVLR